MIRLTKKTFSGSSKIFDGTLAEVLMDTRRVIAQGLVNALTNFTDNSGGVAAASIVNVPAYAAFTAGTTDAVAKAEYEATLTAARKDLRALIAKVNEITVIYPVFDTLTDSLGGAAPTAHTLDAIDDSMTGTSTGGSLVALAGANTTRLALLSRIRQLTFFVNKLAVEFKVTALVDAIDDATVPLVSSTTFAALSVDTGAASSGASTISKAAADPALDIVADNLASLAAKIDAILNKTPSFAG